MRWQHLVLLCWAAMLPAACAPAMEGSKALSAHRYEAAAVAYERWVQDHSNDLRATIRLGYSRYKAGDPHGALAAFEQVLQREPRNPYALFYAGLTVLSLGDTAKALSYWGAYTTGQRFLKRAVEQQMSLLQGMMDRTDFDPSEAAPKAAVEAERAMAQAYANQKPEDDCVERRGMINSGDCDRQLWMPESLPYLP
jgi:tetratricopeptide (TPR) repeat protein